MAGSGSRPPRPAATFLRCLAAASLAASCLAGACLLAASGALAQGLPLFLSAPGRPVASEAAAPAVPPAFTPSVRVTGSLRAEAAAGQPAALAIAPGAPSGTVRRGFGAALRPEARLDLDARAETGLGPVRGYVSIRSRPSVAP